MFEKNNFEGVKTKLSRFEGTKTMKITINTKIYERNQLLDWGDPMETPNNQDRTIKCVTVQKKKTIKCVPKKKLNK